MKTCHSIFFTFGAVAVAFMLALTPCSAEKTSHKSTGKAQAKPVVKHKKPPTVSVVPPPAAIQFPAYAQPLVRPDSPYQRKTGSVR